MTKEDQPWIVVEALLEKVSDDDLSHLFTLIVHYSLKRRLEAEDYKTFKFDLHPGQQCLSLKDPKVDKRIMKIVRQEEEEFDKRQRKGWGCSE